MATLPGLVHDPKTKIGAEVLIYYNLEGAELIGSLIRTNSGVEQIAVDSCAGETLQCPVSGFMAACIPKATGGSAIHVTGSSGSCDFPAYTPVGCACEIQDGTTTDITQFSFTGGEVGDTVDIVCLPHPDDDTLICFDVGFTATVGAADRAIPRKFNAADHFVRQRPENTLTISDLFVSHWDGLQRINGLDVTLIVKVYPDGGSVPSEIQYYIDTRLSVPPMNVPAEANDSVQIDAEGVFGRACKFAAQPSP